MTNISGVYSQLWDFAFILLHSSPSLLFQVLLFSLYDNVVPHSTSNAFHFHINSFSVKIFCLGVDDLHSNLFAFLKFPFYHSLLVFLPKQQMKVCKPLFFSFPILLSLNNFQGSSYMPKVVCCSGIITAQLHLLVEQARLFS